MKKAIITHREPFISGLLKLYDDATGKLSRNLIHLSDDEIDFPIYRIIAFKRLQEVLENKEMVFLRPKKWQDPFENWLLKSSFILKDGIKVSIMSSQDYVGQCWSLNAESDAMWRIYSPRMEGVKIKTTIRKLLLSLINNVEDNSKFEISKFIGKVKYLDKESIISEFKNNAEELVTTNIGQAKTHFFKRPEFVHENEVRILFKTNKQISKDVFKLKVEPNELIDEIILDPRLKSQKSIKTKIEKIRSFGYLNEVKQSDLYHFNDIKLDLNF